MKKILPYILIVIVILQLFVPFTVGSGIKNNLEVKVNKAEAADGGIKLTIDSSKNDTLIIVTPTVIWSIFSGTKEGIRVRLKDTSGKIANKEIKIKLITSETVPMGTVQSGPALFTGLNPDTTYEITVEARQIAPLQVNLTPPSIIWNVDDLWSDGADYKRGIEEESLWEAKSIFNITTDSSGNTNATQEEQQVIMNDNYLLPGCEFTEPSTYLGCIGRLVYWGIFQPTSFIFGLTGKLLDLSVDYSVKDTSYRSDFVVEGWGVIRDFCNMFFIFILLYIAFGTILELHSVKTKEMIINVVIIGLLINFSLFATQIIIDASNILTRVFYNSETIKIGPKVGGVIQDERGSQGEIKLSEAIVSKINPQDLILNASKADNIRTKQSATGGNKDEKGISGTTFLLVAILASVINIVGIITFLSASLIFISRVIGLWLAMIFAPLAFFSYTVPVMQDWEMVGWKNWWPETIKMAFSAPIFVFFLYLIIKFLKTGLGLVATDNATGMDFILGIFIPFIFIMVLLMKAKDIAKTLSGKIGQSITGGIAAVGGMALGGAALGAAAIGRGTVGAFMKGASTGDTSAQRLRAGDPNLSTFGKFKGKLQQISGYEALQKKVGTKLNADQEKVEKSAHARHTLDETAQNRYHKKYDELTQPERQNIHDTIDKNILSRERFGNKTYAQLTNTEQRLVDTDLPTRRTAGTIHHGSQDMTSDARVKQSLKSSILQSSRTGSYDVRNLSSLVMGEQDKDINKFATGLTSALASSMRGIMKQTNINYGTGQKDFIKDLGNTITEALKSTAVKVDLSHVGEEKKEDHKGGHH